MLSSALIVALALSTLTGCRRGNDEEGPAAAPVVEVTLTKVQREVITEDLTVSGNLSALPNQDAKVAALLPGRIAKVNVTEGDRVAAGQELAELENGPIRDQFHQAEATVSQAKANFENARLSAERNEGLLTRGIASRKEVEDARTLYSINKSALEQAEAALSSARTQLSRTVIRAPFAGVVVHRFLGAGEQVDGNGGQPLVEIAAIDTLELMGIVPAPRLSQVRVGQDFTFTDPSVPENKLTARVVAVLPAVDPLTNNGMVRIRIDNHKHALNIGMFVTVELPFKRSIERLVVPRQAVYSDESGEPHIYKVVGDDAESVAVELGAQTKDKIEIVSGAKEGDSVILTGGYGLPEKSKVRVKQ